MQQGQGHLQVRRGVLQGGSSSKGQQDVAGPKGHQALGVVLPFPQQLVLLQAIQLLGFVHCQDCPLRLQYFPMFRPKAVCLCHRGAVDSLLASRHAIKRGCSAVAQSDLQQVSRCLALSATFVSQPA